MHNLLTLSRRQVEIIQCLELGMSNKEIANNLNINEHTVKVHMWRLFKKLGVKSRAKVLTKIHSADLLINTPAARFGLFFDMYKYIKYSAKPKNPLQINQLKKITDQYELIFNHGSPIVE